MGTLYYGDNLDILRRHLGDETVDLVYLEPPFNSAQDYNAFFHENDGTTAASQIKEPCFNGLRGRTNRGISSLGGFCEGGLKIPEDPRMLREAFPQGGLVVL